MMGTLRYCAVLHADSVVGDTIGMGPVGAVGFHARVAAGFVAFHYALDAGVRRLHLDTDRVHLTSICVSHEDLKLLVRATHTARYDCLEPFSEAEICGSTNVRSLSFQHRSDETGKKVFPSQLLLIIVNVVVLPNVLQCFPLSR